MALLKLLVSTENKPKRKHEHIEKVRGLSKVQTKMDNLFLKELKKKNETTEQVQNLSLNPKGIIFPEPFAFKSLPIITMT